MMKSDLDLGERRGDGPGVGKLFNSLMQCNSHTMWFLHGKRAVHPSEPHRSVVFSVFTELGHRPHNVVFQHCHHPRKVPSTREQWLPVPPKAFPPRQPLILLPL